VKRYIPTEEEARVWRAWVDELPDYVAEVARRFPPWELFRLKTSGDRVYPVSYGEQA